MPEKQAVELDLRLSPVNFKKMKDEDEEVTVNEVPEQVGWYEIVGIFSWHWEYS